MSETFNNGMNDRGFTVQDYKDSISADDTNEMFTLAYQWQDKKHRHVWDLCNWIEQLQAEIEQLKAELVAQANDIELAIMIANEAGKAEALESVQPVLDAAKECYRQTNNQPKTEYNDMVLAVAGACAVVNDAYKKYMEE